VAAADPLFDPDVVENPHGYYGQLRATDLLLHELPDTNTFLVTRIDLIHEVVAKPALLSSRSGGVARLRRGSDHRGRR
jgi:hypothetical protein